MVVFANVEMDNEQHESKFYIFFIGSVYNFDEKVMQKIDERIRLARKKLNQIFSHNVKCLLSCAF